MPDFSAIGRILLMYARGSKNSSGVGSNTGASGGGVNEKLSGFIVGDAESPMLTSTLASSHFPIFEKHYAVHTNATINKTLASSDVKEWIKHDHKEIEASEFVFP